MEIKTFTYITKYSKNIELDFDSEMKLYESFSKLLGSNYHIQMVSSDEGSGLIITGPEIDPTLISRLKSNKLITSLDSIN